MKPNFHSLFCIIFLILISSSLQDFLFNIIDKDHDGFITKEEFAKHLEKTEYTGPQPAHGRFQELIDLLFRIYFHDSQRVDEATYRNAFQELFYQYSSSEPQQVHLSLSGIPNEMVVMWVNWQRSNDSVVFYGTQPERLDQKANAVSFTYDKGVRKWNGWIYQATMKNLRYGTKYFYRVGSSSSFSQVQSFTYYGPNIQPKPVRMALIADMGTFWPVGFAISKQMINGNEKEPYDLVTLVGDVAYADLGSNGKYEFNEIWDAFVRQIEPIASKMPFMFVVGNHEQGYNYTAYQTRFSMPGKFTGGFANIYYSFDYAGVHFISLCSENGIAPYAPGSAQYKWLVEDLEKAVANRKNVPYIIVQAHRPMYMSFGHFTNIQSAIEPLMKKYDVDIGLFGHEHCYYRSYPLFNRTFTPMDPKVYKNPKDPVHLLVASAGAYISSKCDEKDKESWMATKLDHYGYTTMEIVNRTTLHFKFHKWVTGKVEDEFYIIKEKYKN